MSAQHTPGPWTQGKSEIGVKCVWLNGATEPKDEMGPSHTWIECGTKANARLIAAAPELLMALKELLGPYVDKPSETTGMMDLLVCGEDIDAARAAIAKAIG